MVGRERQSNVWECGKVVRVGWSYIAKTGGLCGQGGWMGDNHQLELCSSGWRRQNKYFQAKTKETYDLQPWENFFGEYMKRSIYDEYSCKIGFNTRFQLDNDVSKGSAIFFFIFIFTVVSEDVVTITLGNRKIRVGNKKETGPATILATKIYNVFDS